KDLVEGELCKDFGAPREIKVRELSRFYPGGQSRRQDGSCACTEEAVKNFFGRLPCHFLHLLNDRGRESAPDSSSVDCQNSLNLSHIHAPPYFLLPRLALL